MSVLLIGLLCVACIAIICSGLVRRAGYLTYPSLSAFLYLTWVVPQLWALRQDGTIQPGVLVWLILMVLACLAATVLGWVFGLRSSSGRKSEVAASERTLFIGAAAVTAIAYAMQVLIGFQPAEARESSSWSGPLTIFAFLSNVSNVSLALSLLLFFRSRNWKNLALVLANVAITFPVAFVYLRRAEMVTIAVTIPMALWFARRKTFPAPLLAGAAVALILIVFGINELRAAARDEAVVTGRQRGLTSLNVLKSVEFGSKTTISDPRKAKEMRNAAEIISYALYTGRYTYGSSAWNSFIFQWFPGQLFGYQAKSSLMVGESTRTLLHQHSSFEVQIGSTNTGFGSAFLEFGLAGCGFFAISAAVCARLWREAMAGNIFSQVLYMATMTMALHGVTHFAAYYFVSAPLMFITVALLRAFCRPAGDRRMPGILNRPTSASFRPR